MNTLHVGSKTGEGREALPVQGDAGLVYEEGGSDEGLETRRENDIPDTESARKKFFLNEDNRKNWEWEGGRTYGVDFFNAYLDFNGMLLWAETRRADLLMYEDRFCVEITGLHAPDYEVLGWAGFKVSFSVTLFALIILRLSLHTSSTLYMPNHLYSVLRLTLFSRAGKGRSAHTPSDTSSRTVRPTRSYSSSSSRSTSTKTWTSRGM
jgi:Protein of unknown function (DUF1769)